MPSSRQGGEHELVIQADPAPEQRKAESIWMGMENQDSLIGIYYD